ncbi:DUF2398 family protein, partial [Streptomyces corynorhini]
AHVGGPATYVRRMLVETPAVYLDELTGTERDWLRTRQRREARAFFELLGLEAEIRGEGVALVDPEEELTDLRLPGTGTVAQAALLLVERLVERLRPREPGHPATGGRLTVGVAVPDGLVDALLAEVVAEYGRSGGWQRGFLEDPAALREAVLDLLVRMRLMARTGPAEALRSADRSGAAAPGAHPHDAHPPGARPHDAHPLDARPHDSRPRVSRPRDGAEAPGADWVLLAAAARYAPRVTVRKKAAGTGPDAAVQQELTS